LPNAKRDALPKPEPREEQALPRQGNPPPPHLQPVDDVALYLDIPEHEKPPIMDQRRYTTTAWRQLGSSVHYCFPRGDKPIDDDEGEELHITDPDLRIWVDDERKQKLNAAIFLQQGVIEVTFFGPDQSLNECFFLACPTVGIAPRFAIGRRSRPIATSVLFKLRDDEAKRLEEEYSAFKPKAFTLDDARRGIIVRYAPPVRRGSKAHQVTTLLPGSLLWAADGKDYDLLEWRSEDGSGLSKPQKTSIQTLEFFQIVRAAAFASILNVIPAPIWQSQIAPRAFAEWLARVVRDGAAINANVVFAKAARAIIADPNHAEALIALVCQYRCAPVDVDSTRAFCLETFQFARKRLEADPARLDVTGWSGIARIFGEQAQKAFRALLNVGADSTLLEDFAERYLFHLNHSAFIDRQAFREGQANFIFSRDDLTLRHAPNQIQTKKKAVEAFPIFVKSKLRQDVTDVETHPDQIPGSILRVTREGATIPDNDYAPEHSRLIFNDWAGLYVKPAKTIDAALRAECAEKLDHMLSLVTNRHKGRADWIKAHIGWTLKHPGKKQQVALVCTGDQGTGKSFLCTTFAKAVFGKYADTASVRALDGQFYIAGYLSRLWVSHDEFVSSFDNAEILKTLIRGTRVSGEIKGRDTAAYTIFARLAFTSNEANPGISRGRDDRGLFQVTSITAQSEGMLPGEFQDRQRKELKPFYEAYDAFLQRDAVRQAYVRMLIDCAPEKIADVEDLTFSAMRDEDVARSHLTNAQLVARIIIESGTIHGGHDIAMPFRDSEIFNCVQRVTKEMGIRNMRPMAVLDEFFNAGILGRMSDGAYLFKWKIGGLQRLYGVYLGVKLHSQHPLEPNDDRPNDFKAGDAMEPWKGRKSDESDYRRSDDEDDRIKW
jgi:Family of unknown function (DUF5906)